MRIAGTGYLDHQPGTLEKIFESEIEAGNYSTLEVRENLAATIITNLPQPSVTRVEPHPGIEGIIRGQGEKEAEVLHVLIGIWALLHGVTVHDEIQVLQSPV